MDGGRGRSSCRFRELWMKFVMNLSRNDPRWAVVFRFQSIIDGGFRSQSKVLTTSMETFSYTSMYTSNKSFYTSCEYFIIDGGFRSQSIIYVGFQSQSIIDGGFRSQSITDVGVRSQAIIDSGVSVPIYNRQWVSVPIVHDQKLCVWSRNFWSTIGSGVPCRTTPEVNSSTRREVVRTSVVYDVTAIDRSFTLNETVNYLIITAEFCFMYTYWSTC